MIIRVRSRDGLERVTFHNPHITVSELKALVENQLKVPVSWQTLSKNQNLLLARTAQEMRQFIDVSDPKARISSLGIFHGSMIYLGYEGERSVVAGGAPAYRAGSFGRRMSVNDLVAMQMRISRQEKPHCKSVSFDRSAANAFQSYVNESLGFAVKRGGFMYGRVLGGGEVVVDFVYEPPQRGSEDDLVLLRDWNEEMVVEAIALGFGMRRVGFVFNQTVDQRMKGYTLSGNEVLQAVRLQEESGVKEWVTAVVKLEGSDDGGLEVHFEAFQISDVCVRLFKEGWFETNYGVGINPKVSRMKKDVVVGGKDTKEVDNDFFLVAVRIFDHQGLLSSTFPIENRNGTAEFKALKNHLNKTKSLPFVKSISDFHLLLFLAKYLDLSSDVPALAECVRKQLTVPDGYKILIESMAFASSS